jgi:uroporphyrin-3 C-methyltransferase
MPPRSASGSIRLVIPRDKHRMALTDPAGPTAATPRRGGARGRLILWLLTLLLIALAGWQLREWWRTNTQPANAVAAASEEAAADVPGAIDALRREQHALAQRLSDAAAGSQVLRDEVLGVGERAALLEQSVARIASPRAQGEQALRLDEAELLLTIGQQQIELSSDVGSALHAYTLADGTLAGSTDPSVLNLRQSLAQEIAALRALPPDPRANLAGQLDAFEASLLAQPFAEVSRNAGRASVFDRVVGSMVEVRRSEQQDLLDPSARDAALTAVRLELTLARLALARRDAEAFRTALARIESWLPRLFAPDTVARQRAQLATIQRAPLKIELPMLGGTLAELRRLRQAQPDAATKPEPSAAPASKAAPTRRQP